MSHVTQPTRPVPVARVLAKRRKRQEAGDMKPRTVITQGTGMTDALVIPARFCGPPGSGNGGYVCGRIAGYLHGPVTVTLRRPPPLATPMTVERDGGGSVRIHHGPALIAEATSAPGSPALGSRALGTRGAITMAEARMAAGRARYYADPFFPDCFVCGTGRGPGDGLRIFPGPVAGRRLWAAPWTPDPSVTGTEGRVRPEVVWAALDCPGGIAAGEAADLAPDTAILLGQMTASLAALPEAGDQCRVVAWPGGRDGRKLAAGSALIGPGGQVLAAASSVWITVPRPVRALAAEGAS
jgi:hypothetical protein